MDDDSSCAVLDDLQDDSPLIEAADKPFPRPAPRYLVPHPGTFADYAFCPWASCNLVMDHETGQYQLVPVTCKRWGCSYCAPRKIRRLAFLTNRAKPNRWIRLGVRPELYADAKEAWLRSSPALPELCRRLRKEIGECEYLRVCELHKSGMPHYHALLRSNYIPQRMLSRIWNELTSAPVVYIAKIDQSFSSFRYLTKYLTKLHRIEWTDRHVSYSRNFFNAEDLEKLANPTREIIERREEHPWKYLADRYATDVIALERNGVYTLPYKPGMPDRDIPLHDFGLRPPPAADEPVPPQSQLTLAGLEDAAQPYQEDVSF